MLPKDVESSLQYIDDEKSALKDFEAKDEGRGDVVTKQPVNEACKMEEIPLSNAAVASESIFCTGAVCKCLNEWWAALIACMNACCEFGCMGCCEGLCFGVAECMESCGDCCILCIECCKI